MKKVSSIIAATALMISVSAASFAAAPAKKPAKKAPMKEWTFAVFLNADNNLDRFGVEDQQEMARIGSNENLNVITLIDRERGPAQINYIEHGNIKKIKDMGEMDMGDYKELVKFTKFVKENYPAKHYMIGIWNHGSGWKAKENAEVVRGVSYDDSSNNHITNDQLAIATKEMAQVLGQKIDIINMDCCLMGMAEVAYAIKDNCDYFVGSEETEAGKGTPYDDVLRGWKPGMSSRDLAKHWVNAYAESYNGGSQGHDDSTQSAYDLSKVDGLLDAMNGFSKAIMAGKYSDKVMTAASKTVKFAYPQNIDLLHFLKNLRPEVTGDTSLITAMDKVEKAAKEVIIANETTARYGYNKYAEAQGIAVYLPSNLAIESKYLTLDYSKNVLWDDMLMALREQRDVQKTVNAVCKGEFKGLKSAISEAKKNPRSKYARALLRELNYTAYTEKKIPAKDQAEFDRLFKDLKNAMQSK